MNQQISGSHAARTSRPAYLAIAVAPEPTTVAPDNVSPEQAAEAPASDSYVFDLGFEAGLAQADERARLTALATVDGTPEQRAYRAGRLDVLAEQCDIRYRALAGIEQLEEMSIDELEQLVEIASGVAYTKRHARTALRLVGDTDDIGPIVEAALAESRPDEDEHQDAKILAFAGGDVA